jgi:hypothetical protein
MVCRLSTSAASGLAAIALGGCGPHTDLTAIGSPNISGPSSFCRIVKEGPDKGKLIVTVKNKGAVAAPPTTTRVEFIPGGAISLPTPAIAARGSVELKAPIPSDCRKGGCYFVITVDFGNAIKDDDGGDNTVEGHCLG